MKLQLVKETDTQRYYKLPRPIKYYGKGDTIADLFKKDPIRLVDGYAPVLSEITEIDHVCVSDAHTHIERLCFPCFEIRDTATGEVQLIHRSHEHLCGYWTMMIHGGSADAVYPDGVYIRYLLMLDSRMRKLATEQVVTL